MQFPDDHEILWNEKLVRSNEDGETTRHRETVSRMGKQAEEMVEKWRK